MKPIAMVDIDGTLFELSDKMHEKLKEMIPDIPHPNDWPDWEYVYKYLSKKEYWDMLNGIHESQDKYDPMEGAVDVVKFLRDNGYHIVIASQRMNTPRVVAATERFLEAHGIPYDELLIGPDKTIKFPEIKASGGLVYDDYHVTLEKALEWDIDCFGLRYKYNEHMTCELFSNNSEVLTYLFNR